VAGAPRRFNDADTVFLHLDAATGMPAAPLGVGIYAGPFDPEKLEHLRTLSRYVSPRGRQRIVRDRCSPALPRWVDVPDELIDLEVMAPELEPPGDGTLRAVLDWAETWALQPFPEHLPPWRSATFHGVLVDGVPRTVSVSQSHHAMIDGEGARRRGLQQVQLSPDDPMPAIPDEPLPPFESIGPVARWLEGWGGELRALGRLLRRNARRAGRAAVHPARTTRRIRELAASGKALKADLGTEPLSPLLARRTNGLQLDAFEVDLVGLKRGAKAVGGTVNDGFLAAICLGLRRWHADHGVEVPAVRTSMAVNTRAAQDSTLGNDMIAVVVRLPLDSDDPVDVLRRCAEASRRHRTVGEGMRLMEIGRAIGNRMPARIMVRAARRNMRGMDLQVSNLPGLPRPYWVGGNEVLGGMSFPVGTLSGLAVVMVSHGDGATFSMITDPAAVHDRERLVARLQAGFDQIAALAEADRVPRPG
jgi:WS/DGAT/MGAT family acyltransferase